MLDSHARVHAAPSTTADRIADALVALGVRQVFGVSGGGVAYLWGALSRHPALTVIHTQHESGAAFAATEASLASDAPVVVFTTTGPGLTNALTGLIAGRSEGARIIAISGATPAARRRRDATQETHADTPFNGLYAPGALFDEACVIEHASMLPPVFQRISEGLSRGGGFVAHLGVPTDIQNGVCGPLSIAPCLRIVGVADQQLDALAERIRDRAVVVVVGPDARRGGAAIRRLVERIGATFVCTPVAKGILPESHPAFAGVIGFAGGDDALVAVRAIAPDVLLCFGASLGESSTQWSTALAPREAIIAVHPSSDLLSGPFCESETVVVHADPGAVADGLAARLRPREAPVRAARPIRPFTLRAGKVRPSAVMAAIQSEVLDASDALVMAESGNSFAWAIHLLRLETPRLRVSVRWGSMGHFTAGAIGPASLGRATVAIVGDGAMLMGNEVATAVRHGLPVVWVVLNDHGYGMCRQGTSAQDIRGVDCRLAPVDFAALAIAMGARGFRVHDEHELRATLARALSSGAPCVVDVVIDADELAPIANRVRALTWHAPEGA